MISNKNIIGLSILLLGMVISYSQSDTLPDDIWIEERIIRGRSMMPLLQPGQTIQALFGYYEHYPIQRDDVVLVRYAGNKNPLIKIVKGIPGDSLALAYSKSGWNIIVNGEPLLNSEGKKYNISGKGYKMLSLYVRDYNGVIPKNTYLILGNDPTGSLDATRFGLISKSNIIAKVKY
ncbi:signal peptidase I [bacterium]|nr:MAG: signal peptidase I [bacterium]